MKTGDTVRIYPYGTPEDAAQAAVVILSSNRLSIALEFPDAPIFCKRLLDSGGAIGINRETYKVSMLLMREEIDGKPWGPWIELTSGAHFDILPE